jgi:hypothetical protein
MHSETIGVKITTELTRALIFERIALDVQDWAQQCTRGHHESISCKRIKAVKS